MGQKDTEACVPSLCPPLTLQMRACRGLVDRGNKGRQEVHAIRWGSQAVILEGRWVYNTAGSCRAVGSPGPSGTPRSRDHASRYTPMAPIQWDCLGPVRGQGQVSPAFCIFSTFGKCNSLLAGEQGARGSVPGPLQSLTGAGLGSREGPAKEGSALWRQGAQCHC